jgi:lipopolysaccharide/colanic/teichoic acid biosynthesis glycosyltransferase
MMYALLKWLLDLIFSATVIILLFWLLIIVWVLVKLTSSGPGFFVQERVGRDQKVFKCVKFRTMALGTKVSGTHEVNSACVTRIGGFLRKTKIDELPQIKNLLFHEMTLVGPRPCLPSQETLIEARQIEDVYTIMPGITGLAQVQNIDMSEPKKLARIDGEYVRKRSLALDLKIMIQTALGGGQGDKTNTT